MKNDKQFIYDEYQIFEDLLANAGIPNRNRRIYPKEVLEKAFEEYKNKLNKNSTLDHPDKYNVK